MLRVIALAALACIAGCATKPDPYGFGCVNTKVRQAGVGVVLPYCSEWVFGPSRTQAATTAKSAK